MAEKKQGNTNDVQAERRSHWEKGETGDSNVDSTIEQVELLAAGAGDHDNIDEDGLSEKLAELAVTTDEEVDALKINLFQEDERASTRDGSGRIVDDSAEEQIARFTEADPMRGELGAISVDPGLEDTSATIRTHDRKTSAARSDAVVVGNLDEPRDESVEEKEI